MKVFGKIIGASAAALCMWAVPAAAQELKLGYVNSERVLRDSAPAKAAQTKLEAEFGRRERELNDIRTRLKAAADKFERTHQPLQSPRRRVASESWWTRSATSSASSVSSRKT